MLKASSLLYASSFLSTPSARRATESWQRLQCLQRISIHALREEGDYIMMCNNCVPDVISIHALREEGDFQLVGAASGAL